MKTPLVPISITSIYKNSVGDLQPLPARMAKCTPDTYTAIFNIAKDLAKKGGKLILSDLFRSYDMQTQAHADFVSKKKKAFSPPAGGSFHEAGRAFDMDLTAMKIPLADFWTIAAKYKVVPIIDKPVSSKSEAWHFECRGSHQLIIDYYAAGNGTNFKAYSAGAASAILSAGIQVDAFGSNQKQAAIQSGLIRLGKIIGNMDGNLGGKSHKAMDELAMQFDLNNVDAMLLAVENLVQQKFPMEFITPSVS
jgi:D-alanyl-D-alanine carboxypeptidase